MPTSLSWQEQRTIVFSGPQEVSDGKENDAVERYKKIVERGAALVVLQLRSRHLCKLTVDQTTCARARALAQAMTSCPLIVSN